MANIKILGDTLQVKISLTEDQIKKVKIYKPEALKLIDDNGNELFGIGIGNAHLSDYGVTFSSTDFDGTMYLTVNNPVTLHNDEDEERQTVIECYARTITNLNKIEAQIAEVIDEIEAMEEAVADSIDYADSSALMFTVEATEATESEVTND